MSFLYTLVSCLTCSVQPNLRINGRSYRIIRLLGEGGFSYVYLAEADNGHQYALKKVRCPFGAESLAVAMQEIDAYRLFDSPAVTHLVDSAIVQEGDGSKTVYMVLPYYRRGNLQDLISRNIVEGESVPERKLVRLFVDICRAVRVLHKHRPGRERAEVSLDDAFAEDMEQEGLLDDLAPVNDGSDDEDAGEVVAYAHGDIKPANIMLDDSGSPVLMDLGSCALARIHVDSRKLALDLQDRAAEHCTLPYRAPELFDVQTGAHLDERVDVWSLGCTLFALMYSSSPFEMQETESGASLNLAICNGQFRFPDTPEYSQGLKDLVSACLTVDPQARPWIDTVIRQTEDLL